MTDSLPGRTTPEGSSDNLKVVSPITSVWPALWPPWKRTTTSASTESQSTILPFPSSPHWAPTTTTLAKVDCSFGSLDERSPGAAGNTRGGYLRTSPRRLTGLSKDAVWRHHDATKSAFVILARKKQARRAKKPKRTPWI